MLIRRTSRRGQKISWDKIRKIRTVSWWLGQWWTRQRATRARRWWWWLRERLITAWGSWLNYDSIGSKRHYIPSSRPRRSRDLHITYHSHYAGGSSAAPTIHLYGIFNGFSHSLGYIPIKRRRNNLFRCWILNAIGNRFSGRELHFFCNLNSATIK